MQMAGKAFDIWLIPEFHGVSSDHMVSEWLEQVGLTCNQMQMAGKAFDIRLIPEFHGVLSDHTVSEWLEQVEQVSEMCGVDNVECVLRLKLRGGALSVYRWLTRDQREDLQQVKQTLLVAFAPDPFVAFDTFVSHHLRPGETVDEYLDDLQD